MHHVIAKNFRLEGRAREFCTFTVETMAPGLLAEYQFVAYILRLLLWKSESNETSDAVSSTSDVTSTRVRRLKQIKRRVLWRRVDRDVQTHSIGFLALHYQMPAKYCMFSACDTHCSERFENSPHHIHTAISAVVSVSQTS